mmetsp:Transcript_5995/g.14190  ORF Transcript_5995/g.14190 Transcript_5995/m.14190 type:complete len:82 (-) Transcript_5995:232-477(-)
MLELFGSFFLLAGVFARAMTVVGFDGVVDGNVTVDSGLRDGGVQKKRHWQSVAKRVHHMRCIPKLPVALSTGALATLNDAS